MERTRTFFLAVGCALLILSCKEKEGLLDFPQNAPRLLSASVQPASVHIDSNRTNVDSLGNDLYRVRIVVSAEATDADGASDVAVMSLVITGPRTTAPLASGILPRTSAAGDTARFSDSLAFLMNRSDAGVVTIKVQARDYSHLFSNAFQNPLIVNRNNSRPQIFNLSVPDTVARPNSGSRLVFLAISASDSDGLGDIAKVFFKSVNSTNPNFEQPLFDDGQISVTGDSVAGDGRYSRILPLSSTDSLGTREFRFWARDFPGALSDSIIHFITIVPE